MYKIKPIPVELVKSQVELVKIQVEFWARMAYEKEHEVKLDVKEKVKGQISSSWNTGSLMTKRFF